jgi:peptidoglycan/LPS O-acetylase OafA/YrhL
MEMHYRKDIQLLRGISVLLVVLFHLGLGGMQSGFLGVDVFFVISGFLMAILYDHNNKIGFFLKRAKRLLPAYFVTILFTFIAAFFITIPNEFNSTANQSLIATIFASNIGYWFENSYFSKEAFNPLLHLWSLGVEIQFYLIIPFLFWFLDKSKIYLPLLLALSLAGCFFIVGISPKTSFFMMPLRLWEFLIGYYVATQFTKNGAIKDSVVGAWLGIFSLLIIIGIPLINVDGKSLDFIIGHPGINALIVSLAVGVILAYGIPKYVEESKLGSFLELAGKYSYSIYLVHFPVIVLFLYEPFTGTNLKLESPAQTLLLVTGILILSFLMYQFVEVPTRYFKNTPRWLYALSSVVIIFSLTGPNIQKFNHSEKEILIFDAWTDRSNYRCGKVFRMVEPNALSCEITEIGETPTKNILLVGDSHADSIKTIFSSVASKQKVSVRFMVANNPLKRGGLGPEHLIKEALKRKTNAIILHYSPNSLDIAVVEELVVLAKEKRISVGLIMPVPVWEYHIPRALWKNINYNEKLPAQSLKDYEDANHKFYDELKSLEFDNFRVYPVGNLFCNQNCQLLDASGKPLYFDDGHLTLTGSKRLINLFEKIISSRFRLDDQKV